MRICASALTDGQITEEDAQRNVGAVVFFFFEPRGEVLKDVGLEKKKKTHTHRRNHLTFLSSSQVVLT